jgi:hypothetical protein
VFSIFFLLLVARDVLAQTTKSIGFNTNVAISTYRNSSLGIITQYPTNWTTSVNFAGPNMTVKFQPSPNPVPSVSITVKPSVSKVDSITNLSREQIASVSSWAKITRSTPTVLANNPAYKIEYTYTKPGFGQYSEKWVELWTIKDHRQYIIRYVAQPSEYNKYLPAVQNMINTLSLGRLTMTTTPNITSTTMNNATSSEIIGVKIIPSMS